MAIAIRLITLTTSVSLIMIRDHIMFFNQDIFLNIFGKKQLIKHSISISL